MALALVMLVIGSIVIVPCMTTASSMLKINEACEANTNAIYAAESGIQDVVWRFNNNITPTFPYTLSNTINGLTVTITEAVPHTTQDFTVTYTLNSAAKQSAQTRGKVMVQILHNTGSSPFYYGIVALNGNVTIGTSAQITSTPANNGDVWANGNISLGTSSNIYGTAAATGTISIGTSAHIYQGTSPNQPTKEFQPMDMTWYLNQANAGGTYVGDLTIPTSTQNYNLGPKHITGNLSIGTSSTVNLNGVVWVDGTITVGTSAQITAVSGGTANYMISNGNFTFITSSKAYNNPTLMSVNGNVTLQTSVSGTFGSIYAPNGTADIETSANVNGSVVAKNVTLGTSAHLNYPVNLQTNPPPGFSGGNSTTITSYAYY